jgi:hypothetical protein
VSQLLSCAESRQDQVSSECEAALNAKNRELSRRNDQLEEEQEVQEAKAEDGMGFRKLDVRAGKKGWEFDKICTTSFAPDVWEQCGQ